MASRLSSGTRMDAALVIPKQSASMLNRDAHALPRFGLLNREAKDKPEQVPEKGVMRGSVHHEVDALGHVARIRPPAPSRQDGRWAPERCVPEDGVTIGLKQCHVCRRAPERTGGELLYECVERCHPRLAVVGRVANEAHVQGGLEHKSFDAGHVDIIAGCRRGRCAGRFGARLRVRREVGGTAGPTATPGRVGRGPEDEDVGNLGRLALGRDGRIFKLGHGGLGDGRGLVAGPLIRLAHALVALPFGAHRAVRGAALAAIGLVAGEEAGLARPGGVAVRPHPGPTVPEDVA